MFPENFDCYHFREQAISVDEKKSTYANVFAALGPISIA